MKRILSFAAACFLAFAPLTVLADPYQPMKIIDADLSLLIDEGYYGCFVTDDGEMSETLHYDEEEDLSFKVIERSEFEGFCRTALGDDYSENLAFTQNLTSMLIESGSVSSDPGELAFYPINGTDTYAVIDEICAYHGDAITSCRDVQLYQNSNGDENGMIAVMTGSYDVFCQVPIAGILTLKSGNFDSYVPYDLYTKYLSYHSVWPSGENADSAIDVFLTDSPILELEMDDYHSLTDYRMGSLPAKTASLDRKGEQTVRLYGEIYCMASNAETVNVSEEPRTPNRTRRPSGGLAAVATTAAAGTLLGVAGASADNKAANDTGSVPAGSRSLQEAIEDGAISVEGITEELIHEKDAQVVFPISNENDPGLNWHYLCKTLVGNEVAGAHCLGSQVIVSLKGETMKEDEQLLSILVLGWALDAGGKLHKGLTGFEVTVYRPGLAASLSEDGSLAVVLRENSNVKGILHNRLLAEGEYTVEDGVIRLAENHEITCPVPQKEA